MEMNVFHAALEFAFGEQEWPDLNAIPHRSMVAVRRQDEPTLQSGLLSDTLEAMLRHHNRFNERVNHASPMICWSASVISVSVAKELKVNAQLYDS